MSSREIADPEVRLLASIAAALKGDYVKPEKEDPWTSSPFAWIKGLPSRQRGKIGEQLVAGWCAAKGFDVTHTGDSQADRLIQGCRVEIKFSTLWESGVYKFQQIRHQAYSHIVCLGLSPFDAHCWAIPKDLLLKMPKGVTHQHGGRAGTDTYWLSFKPSAPLEWLSQYGGTLSRAFEVIKRLQAK